jgi:hypothetical protein
MVCIMVLWYVYVLCIINETAGGWGEGGSSNSQDSYFSHILGNDAEQGLVFHCPQGSTL